MSSRLSRSPRLRMKRGCVTCMCADNVMNPVLSLTQASRDRRKKCDERKSTCVACERLGYQCRWPDLASLEDHRERGKANSRWSRTSESRDSGSAKSDSASPTSSIATRNSAQHQTGQFSDSQNTFPPRHLTLASYGRLKSSSAVTARWYS